MSQIDLAHAFGLPPAKAIDYFTSKGYAITWDWNELWQEAQAKAFTVAKATSMDVLQDIRGAVESALKKGKTLADFEKELTPMLQRKGWWGRKESVDQDTGEITRTQLGSPWRLKTIYQTNLQTAYMAGRYKSFMENVDDRPYWEYVAVLDARTRPSHRALNGRVFRYDDQFWNSFYPPNGFNCRCRVRAHSENNMQSRDLQLSKSDGRMEEKWLTVSKKTGETAPVMGYRDPFTNKTFTPDVGWSYNPGKAWMKPFTPPPLDTLPRSFAPGVALPDLPKPAPVDAKRILPTGLPPDDYANHFLSEFGASLDKPVLFKDVTGQPLTISDDLFKDGAGQWKILKNDREPYLPLLADTIRTPDEIWLRWEESRDKPGAWLLKRRYIKAFELSDGVFGLGVFEAGQDGWSGSTLFMPKIDRTPQSRMDYIQKQRNGFLHYRKGS